MIRAFDLFAGGGGSSWGARAAGVNVVGAVDMDPLAELTFLDNFPAAKFLRQKAEDVDLARIRRELGRIDLLLASPECTNHTCAKGNGERSESSKMTAFEVTRFAEVLKPRWIVMENVVHMRQWDRYQEFLQGLRALGYEIAEFVLNASHYGVPQSRRRLFVVCDREATPPDGIPKSAKKIVSARQVVDLNGRYPYSLLRKRGRATATIQRANRAIKELGNDADFLLVYYGSDAAGGWQRIDAPLRTITTLDRFALVKRTDGRHVMRMLQVDELRAAMGFDCQYKLHRGTRRDKVRLLGNAVCPPVMEAVVRGLGTRELRGVSW